jgi:hypothetical protein
MQLKLYQSQSSNTVNLSLYIWREKIFKKRVSIIAISLTNFRACINDTINLNYLKIKLVSELKLK